MESLLWEDDTRSTTIYGFERYGIPPCYTGYFRKCLWPEGRVL